MTINVTRDAIFLLSTSSNLEGRPGENTLSQNMAADAAKKNEEESDKDSKRGDAPVKLSHKQFRRLVKKERRRKKRQQAAKKREQEELEEKWRIDNDPVFRAKIEAKERKDKKRLLEEEEERKTQHCLWLEREAIAQERFRKKKEDEERKIREKEEQEERIKREWEEEKRREKEKEEQKQKAIKEKEDALFKELDKPSTCKNSEAWHNPLAPPAPGKSYGTEQDTVNCSFYLKTGACRFGERCSRQHPRPSSSLTLMIPAMYNDIRLSQSMLDEADQDTSLEYDDKEAYEDFKQFYEDTLPEFRKAGSVVQFKVCCNHEPHLRGNVYVQFASEEGCAKAFAMFNARWYASKQLSCEFSPVTKWKSAICGLFERNRCPRGKNCNFLHVYRNPGNEFNHREELSPGHTPYNGRGSERSERSDRDRRRDQRSRYRELDRDISRNRDWTVKEYRKRRKREWSRERDDSYYRHRRWSEEKDHNRGKHEEQDKRLRKDCTSDEGDEGENEDKHLSERLSANVNESEDTVAGNEKHWHSYDSKDKTKKKKRRHHSPEKHIHRRKSQKRHKHHSERKKKKRRSRSRSESSSSESGSD